MTDPDPESTLPSPPPTPPGGSSTDSFDPAAATINPVVGPYHLVRRLGAGAFGEVWLADRSGALAVTRLAVKLPHPGWIDVEAVRREARVWAEVGNHPNVQPIFEATVYDGRLLIASEYAADGSLADWLTRHGGRAPDWPAAGRMFAGILAGLAHLHDRGVIHRDVKPGNILMHGATPRLADFGLARWASADDTGRPAGSPAYMAPEAFDGVRSERTDLWAAGVVFYQLLSGRLPYPQREWTSVLKALLTADPPPLPDAVPEPVRRVAARCLAKVPADRPASAAAAAAELAAAVQAAGGAEPVRPPASDVRLAVHFAAFAMSRQYALFINATNLSETADRVLTHVWLEADGRVPAENPDRPLPKRLKPQETWETWIVLGQIPTTALADIHEHVRARLSTGEVLTAVPNTTVGPQGYVPGGRDDETGAPSSTRDPSTRDATTRRSWWKFW